MLQNDYRIISVKKVISPAMKWFLIWFGFNNGINKNDTIIRL